MEPRISLITLGVDDLERSLRFYRDGLGFPTTWTPDKGVIFFKTRGTALALYPYKSLAYDVGEAFHVPRTKFPGITLAHNVREREEVDQLLAQAEAAGGRIEKLGQKAEWGGYSGYFSDPDGYLWEIAWGAFPFNEDGSLQIP
ncbi:MAG: VOC family protein [Chthoniobacterales bacterium]|nr:VOC family protein [Chthoniobacterales bacterium]